MGGASEAEKRRPKGAVHRLFCFPTEKETSCFSREGVLTGFGSSERKQKEGGGGSPPPKKKEREKDPNLIVVSEVVSQVKAKFSREGVLELRLWIFQKGGSFLEFPNKSQPKRGGPPEERTHPNIFDN